MGNQTVHKPTLLLLLLGSFLVACKASSATCYLATNGGDSPTCNSTQPCATISFCMTSYAPQITNLTVSLSQGTYGPNNCGVSVNSPWSRVSFFIVAPLSNSVVIDCQNSGLNHFTFQDRATTSFTIANITLRNGNNRQSNGGCVFASNITNLIIQNVVFENCTAMWGGGLYSNSPTYISYSNFSFNTATSNGGALYLSSYSNGTTLDHCQINSNNASLGAGIYLDGTFLAVLYGNVVGNNASANGGGLYIKSSDPKTVGQYNFGSTSITNNWAALYGGGLYAEGLVHAWNVFGANFTNNWAPSGNGDTNIACSVPASSFCDSCTAKDCTSDCLAGTAQSCSLITGKTPTVLCYGTKFQTCSSTSSCICQNGLPKSAKILIVLIAVCMFIGVGLILVDVVRHILRRRSPRGYTPIK